MSNQNDDISRQGEFLTEYITLNTEIKNTIERQNQMYKDLQSSMDSDYKNDRKNIQIDEKITDLTEHRNNIWDFLNQKYKDNTELRQKLFARQCQLTKQKEEQENEMKYLKSKVNDMSVEANTTKRHFQEEKYQKQKYEYYSYLHQVSVISLVSVSIILGLGYANLINGVNSLLVSAIIIVGLMIYAVYYIYIVNLNRNNINWNKFYFPLPKTGSSCSNLTDNYKSEEEKEREEQVSVENAELLKMTKI